jgi:hypothetical protein
MAWRLKNAGIADISRRRVRSCCLSIAFHVRRYLKIHCYKSPTAESMNVLGSRKPGKGQSRLNVQADDNSRTMKQTVDAENTK